MNRFNQTTYTGTQETVYREQRTPSADASDVMRWVIVPAMAGGLFGVGLFGGVALAGITDSVAGFTIGMASAGGGLMGIVFLGLRMMTFDKEPAVSIMERTPVAIPQPDPPQTVGGNRPVFVPSQAPHEVEHNGRSYSFTMRQLRLMVDRVEDENLTIARDAFGIETGAYAQVQAVMAGRGYWQKGRGVAIVSRASARAANPDRSQSR